MNSARRPIPISPDDGVDAVGHHDMDGAESAIGGIPGQFADPDYTLEGKKIRAKAVNQRTFE